MLNFSQWVVNNYFILDGMNQSLLLQQVGYGTWGLSFFVLFKAPPHLLLKDNIEVQYSPL